MDTSILYPTFEVAQKLYSQYCTIQTISVLYHNLEETLDNSYLSTLHDLDVHDIYNQIILQYYPNEICIKSSFINQALIKGKSHVTIFELPIGRSRVDLCKINGTSVAYEIKTDLDNLSRLEKQVNDYQKIFEQVYIICSTKNLDNIIAVAPSNCGIYTYYQNKKGKYRFNLFRNTVTQKEVIEPYEQLKILSKKELASLLPHDSQFTEIKDIHKYILDHFEKERINSFFKQILKQRYRAKWEFLKHNHCNIHEIDYQWFYKNQIDPSFIYH